MRPTVRFGNFHHITSVLASYSGPSGTPAPTVLPPNDRFLNRNGAPRSSRPTSENKSLCRRMTVLASYTEQASLFPTGAGFHPSKVGNGLAHSESDYKNGPYLCDTGRTDCQKPSGRRFRREGSCEREPSGFPFTFNQIGFPNFFKVRKTARARQKYFFDTLTCRRGASSSTGVFAGKCSALRQM